MSVKERVYSIILEEKIKKDPIYAKRLGIEVAKKNSNKKKM